MTDQGRVDSRFDGFPGMVLGGSSRQGALRVVGTQVAVLAPRGVPLHWISWR
jgi:hypothetical protein